MSTITYSYFNTLLFNLFNDNSAFVAKPKTNKAAILKETRLESNISDPRVSFLEERISSLENGSNAIATKSVKSARFSIIKNLLEAGDNVVTFNSWSLYHEDKDLYSRLGIDIRIPRNERLDSFKNLIDQKTKLAYLETISPRLINIPDFQKIIGYARSLGIPVVVDNTASVGGYLLKPIVQKANIVIESLEDYLPAHSKYNTVVIDAANFPWLSSRITKLGKKELFKSFHILDEYRKKSTRKNFQFLIPSDPFSLAKHLENIPQKAKLKSENAVKLARYLEGHILVKSVNYTGLASNNSHFNSLTYFQNGFGHYLSFELAVRSGLTQGFFLELSKEPSLKRNISFDPTTQAIYFNVPAIEFEELKSYFDKGLNLLKGSLEYYKTFREPFYV